MRKWLCLGIVTVATSVIGGYWLSSKPTPVPVAVRPQPVVLGEKHDGDAETSDTIEPLVVDQGGGRVLFRAIPLATEEMMPRAVFTTGMVQPPRPDAELSKRRGCLMRTRKRFLRCLWIPITRILESARPNSQRLRRIRAIPRRIASRESPIRR